jgi:hypothetical protein
MGAGSSLPSTPSPVLFFYGGSFSLEMLLVNCLISDGSLQPRLPTNRSPLLVAPVPYTSALGNARSTFTSTKVQLLEHDPTGHRRQFIGFSPPFIIHTCMLQVSSNNELSQEAATVRRFFLVHPHDVLLRVLYVSIADGCLLHLSGALAYLISDVQNLSHTRAPSLVELPVRPVR